MTRSRRASGRDRPAASNPLLLDREDPERAAGRHILQALVAGEQRIDAADAAGHGDVLPAVLLPGDRLSLDARAGLELPQLLAGVGVESLELTGELTAEDHAARRRQHAREARQSARRLPLVLSRQRIDRLQIAARLVAGRPFPEVAQIHAEIPVASLVLGGHGL